MTQNATAPLTLLDHGTTPCENGCRFCADFSYRIVRMYFRGGSRTIRRNVSKLEAMLHCNDSETSSSTCTSAAGRRRTARLGPWFDGWDSK